ncbi:hypothetical protein [Pseudomonas indica]|uniref:Uncharacterized protein n=1 Tax=Pseudomonas indica TaxID=137658 RepID=A0A1G8V2U6_9PSED|nr:hypothetical protein [Pseudomonas indica]SDJ60351.1 hypothetical protein SAMN05216186_10279 [Pseudomonas indica]
MHTATLHAHPACDIDRIFKLRRAAEMAGVRYIPRKPRLISSKPQPAPFDPNDGGRAA